MADDKKDDPTTDDDSPVVTTRSARRGKQAPSDGSEAVALEGPGGTKVTAPARSVDRLKKMGFK